MSRRRKGVFALLLGVSLPAVGGVISPPPPPPPPPPPAGITAPVLSNFASGGTWDTNFPDATDTVGLTRELQVSDDNFSTLRQDLIKLLSEQDLEGTTAASWASTSDPPPRDSTTLVITGLNMGTSGLRYIRERLVRDDGVTSDWSNVVSVTLVDPNATTQWSLNIPSNTQGGANAVIGEMKFRQIIGDATSAVVPSGLIGNTAGFAPTQTPDLMLDGNPDTYWLSATIPQRLLVNFAAPVAIYEILLTAAAVNPTSNVSAATWDRWNGSAWVTMFSFVANDVGHGGAWNADETRSFHA